MQSSQNCVSQSQKSENHTFQGHASPGQNWEVLISRKIFFFLYLLENATDSRKSLRAIFTTLASQTLLLWKIFEGVRLVAYRAGFTREALEAIASSGKFLRAAIFACFSQYFKLILFLFKKCRSSSKIFTHFSIPISAISSFQNHVKKNQKISFFPAKIAIFQKFSQIFRPRFARVTLFLLFRNLIALKMAN